MTIATLLVVLVLTVAGAAHAAHQVTIETVAEAYIAQRSVTVNVFARNEVGLLEYFNLIEFDAARLEYAGIAADRGQLWYGYYPTHVEGNRVYVHGVASSCIDPDLGDPGAPLYHLVFNVKGDAASGFATVDFVSDPPWDGHWNDCSGYAITPAPAYVDGGVDVLGHAAQIAIGGGSAAPGEPVDVDVRLDTALDVYEYFHRIVYDASLCTVGGLTTTYGALTYGYYPTHVSNDTIYVHGYAAGDDCFPAGTSPPAPPLYTIHFTVRPDAAPGAETALDYAPGDAVWDHWIGCDLVTTDSFLATGGAIAVQHPTAVEDRAPARSRLQLGPAGETAVIRFRLAAPAAVDVAVYDLRGRRLRRFADEARAGGWQELTWDGRDATGRLAPSGTYLVILRGGGETLRGRWTLVR
jgi:hypothetical protein